MLSVIILSVIILNVIMLSVIMLNVIMLSVVTPLAYNEICGFQTFRGSCLKIFIEARLHWQSLFMKWKGSNRKQSAR